MKYFKVQKNVYKDPNCAVSTDGKSWQPAKPELLSPNLKEWFIHTILRKHFSFGQSFCVVCGKEAKRGF